MPSMAARRRQDLRRYTRILTRWWWLFVLCSGIATVSAYGVGKAQATSYRATALIVVDQGGVKGDSYTSLLASNQLVQTYLNLIKTSTVLNAAAAQVKGVSGPELAGRVRLSNPGISTQIIQVQVDDGSPRRAAKLANAVVGSFIGMQRHLLGTSNIRIVQPAVPPKTPQRSSHLQVAIAGLAGLLLAACLIWLMESLDDRVRTLADVEQAVGLPTLGVLASMHQDGLVPAQHSGSQQAETFRILRANLGFAGLEAPFSTVVVTSPAQGEGKTTVAINLAASLAMSGKRVLLVDGDLRHPTIHERIGIKNEGGLTMSLLGDNHSGKEQHLFPRVPGVRDLWALPAGPAHPYPTELLGSPQMQCFFDSVLPSEGQSGLVDVVILDTPPVTCFTDAAVVAARASATLLVVDAKRTHEEQLVRACEALTRAHAHVVGVLLNNADAQAEEMKLESEPTAEHLGQRLEARLNGFRVRGTDAAIQTANREGKEVRPGGRVRREQAG